MSWMLLLETSSSSCCHWCCSVKIDEETDTGPPLSQGESQLPPSKTEANLSLPPPPAGTGLRRHVQSTDAQKQTAANNCPEIYGFKNQDIKQVYGGRLNT